MSVSLPQHPLRFTLVLAGLALAAVGYGTIPASAAGADPSLPAVSILEVKKGEDKPAVPASTSKGSGTAGRGSGGNRNSGGSSGGARGAKVISATKGDLTYIITVRNNGRTAAKNVQVEYHFYNRTVVTDNGLSEAPTITDISGTENVDIDPGKMKDIQTQSIPHENTQNQNAGTSSGGGRTRTVTSGTYSSSVTSLLGWHIEVKYNDKIIQKRDEPDNLQDLLKKYNSN